MTATQAAVATATTRLDSAWQDHAVTPLQLVDRARTQPEVPVDRIVGVPGPELAALLRSGRPTLVSELNAHPDQRKALRRYRYGHLLGSPLSPEAIRAWERRNPRIILPSDMLALLVVVDGIHLWADLDTGRAYFGILPLSEWCCVREHLAAPIFAHLPDTAIVLSYHHNGDYFLLMDPAGPRFTWFDPQSPDDSPLVATAVDDLLGWWWNLAQELDPRRE